MSFTHGSSGGAAASAGGVHFSEPWLMAPAHGAATRLEIYDSGAVTRDSTTTAFFTEMDRRGLQNTTNWSSDTYKTLLTVSSGKGLIAGYVGCTAGGSETHTVEITIDGVLTEIVITGLASGDRASLLAGSPHGEAMFTAASGANSWADPGGEALDSGKQIFVEVVSYQSVIVPWRTHFMFGIPCLRFDKSLLVRAKHSAGITNSTATAYSGIMYRLGL